MYESLIMAILLPTDLLACISNQYSKLENLYFYNKSKKNIHMIGVKKNSVLCENEKLVKQNCSIHFYIEGIQASQININNNAQYYMKSEKDNFKAKNSHTTGSKSYEIDFDSNQLKNKDLTLSIDKQYQLFILNEDKVLGCSIKHIEKKELIGIDPSFNQQTTILVNLTADTLFNFNGSTLNDLFLNGRQEILDLANNITSGYASVCEINQVGHTDHFSCDSYNQKFVLGHVKTARNLLI